MILFRGLGLLGVVAVAFGVQSNLEDAKIPNEDNKGINDENMFGETNDLGGTRLEETDEGTDDINDERYAFQDNEYIDETISKEWEDSDVNALEEEEQLESKNPFEMFSEDLDDGKADEMTAFVDTLSSGQHRTTLRVNNGGPWGDWGDAEYCQDGSYAVGYDLKIEPKQGSGRGPDDTALNAIQLICEYPNGNSGGRPTSLQGPWGDWEGHSTCDNGYFLTKFQLQVESPKGYWVDDTAANFVKFECRNRWGYDAELALYPKKGHWGSYGHWSDDCPTGQAICGLQTRVERRCGRCDDTALNDVKFFCCN